MKRAIVACGLFAAIVGGIAAAEAAEDLKNHRPQFRWTTDPEGRHAIYDGPLLVADFYAGSESMRGIGRPISLHNLRLVPGGPPANLPNQDHA